MKNNDTWHEQLLICPDCHGLLIVTLDNVHCENCHFKSNNSKDLRAKNPSQTNLNFYRTLKNFDPQTTLKTVSISPPKIQYSGPKALRESSAFMSLIMEYFQKPCKVLDLGCGPKDQLTPISHLGHLYVGVDYFNVAADYLIDAHSIPFQTSSFDCVFSYAVLEHLHNPFIAIQEINRVLKPGGIFIGTVSQGEPFHDSYFHITPWGFISLINSVPSLKIERLWASMDTIKSLSRMGRYPRLIKSVLAQIDKLHESFPIMSPRKMKWSSSDLALDKLYRAGSICFLVEKLDI